MNRAFKKKKLINNWINLIKLKWTKSVKSKDYSGLLCILIV